MSQTTARGDWLERRLAIEGAADRKDGQYLIAALVDPDHRALAARLVGELGVVDASQPLMRLLVANDPHVRSAAATALGRLRCAGALPQLHSLALHDEEVFVRSWAIAALGEIGGPESLDLLLPLLNDPSMRVRAAAALALGNVGDARALHPLRMARRKLRRSLVDWYFHRRVYAQAIKALEAK